MYVCMYVCVYMHDETTVIMYLHEWPKGTQNWLSTEWLFMYVCYIIVHMYECVHGFALSQK
jgi:hypothetical protein